MKKLLKLLSAALITAAMFMSCGNPASTTVPDQDDGLTVEQFQSKLLAFECGITASGNAVIIYKVENQEKDEYLYIKREGTWEYAGNTSLLHLKKENNEFYITGDGEKLYSYTFTGNNLNLISSLPEFKEVFGSNTATFTKTTQDNLPADLKPLLEKDDGETVEQFIEKLIEFTEGVTTDEQLKLRFYKLDNGEAAFDICPQKDNYKPTAEKGAFNLTHKLEKYYNNKYVYEKNMFYFSLSENKLTFEYADVEEMKDFFNNAPNNTLYFFKQN